MQVIAGEGGTTCFGDTTVRSWPVAPQVMRRALDALIDAPVKAWSNPRTLNHWFDFGDESLPLARLLWVLFSSDCARFGCVDASDIRLLFDGKNASHNARLFELSVNDPRHEFRSTDDCVSRLLVELSGQRIVQSLLCCEVCSDQQPFAVERLNGRLDVIDDVLPESATCVAVARGLPRHAGACFDGAAISDILLVSQ